LVNLFAVNSHPAIRFLWLWVLLLVVPTPPSFAAKESVALRNGQVVLVTGDKDGIHYRLGEDLQKFGQLHGFDVVVKSSLGSLDNLMSIVNDDRINIAFVQADVPSWISQRLNQSDRPGSDIRKYLVKVRTYYPLFDEWVQIVARKKLNSLADLKEGKIAVDSHKSGTFLTMGNLSLKEKIPFDLVAASGSEALEKLLSGEVDAVASVSSDPIVTLNAPQSADFHLVPIILTQADPVYVPTEIPVGTYAWQKEPVKTVSVKILLASYDYSQDMDICQRLTRFSDVLRKNVNWLRTHGQRQWKQVDFDAVEAEGKKFLRSHCLSY